MQTSKDIESKSLDRRVRSDPVSCAVCPTRRRAMVLQAINPNIEHGSISLVLTQPAFALRAEDLPASCSQGARGTHSARSGPKSVARTLLSRSRLPTLPLPPGNMPRYKGHVSCCRHRPPRPCSRTTLQSTPCTISALARCTPAPPQMPPATLAPQPYCCVPMPQQLDHPAPLPSSEPSEPSSHQRHVCSKSCSLTGKERNTNPDEVACTGALFSCALFCIALHCLASLGTLSTKQCTNTPLVRALLCIVSHVQCISAGYTQQSVKAISCPSWRNTAAV